MYRTGSYIKVFELDLEDKSINNIDLLEYVKVLKIPKFRGVELPKEINPVECGIVNLNTPEEPHWVCYAKVYKNRCYFDSFGEKIPLEILRYMKTEEEFRDKAPVIQTTNDSLQRVDTKISGHLCLFVLTSLMRECLPFKEVMKQLSYAYTKQFYWFTSCNLYM